MNEAQNTANALLTKDAEVETATTQETSQPDVEQQEVSEPIETQTEDWQKKYSELEHKYKSESGKISQLERDRNKFEESARIVEALNRAAREDKDFMRLANKKLVDQGLLDPSVLDDVETPKPTAQANQLVQPVVQPRDPAIEWARRKAAEEVQNEVKFFDKFEADKTDITEGSPERVRVRRQSIASLAQLFMTDGLSREDAFNRAYIQVLHPEKIREDGQIEGMVKAKATPSIGGGVGGTAKSSGVYLSEKERKVARAFGMSDAEYSEWKPKN